MTKSIHGGDIYSLQEEYAGEILDFSANINPLGMPQGVKQAAIRALEDCARYPDPACRRLSKALGEHEQVPPEQVICGNGAADLIFRIVLAQRPRKAVLTAPSFAEYQAALAVTNCAIDYEYLEAEKDFALTKSFLERLGGDVDLVFLCNPNNPTGKRVSVELLGEIMGRCREKDILLVLDNCFEGFLEEPPIRGLPPYQNVFVLKAFTKLYAMAGLRLGYGLCRDQNLLREMHRRAQPWSVSLPAQEAGIAALREKEYVAQSRWLVQKERSFLMTGLRSLGLQVYDSEANFILFRAGTDTLDTKLRKQGILIRNCGNFPGLTPNYYRIAVRTRKENQHLLACLAGILKEQ